MQNFLKIISIFAIIAATAFACNPFKSEEDNSEQNAIIAAAIATADTCGQTVGRVDSCACTAASQCATGTCINGTCGGVIAGGGSLSIGATCSNPGVMTPNSCINSTCGLQFGSTTAGVCGGRGAGCQTSANCATPQTGSFAGCGNLSNNSKVCGGTGAACGANGQCVSSNCSSGFCT